MNDVAKQGAMMTACFGTKDLGHPVPSMNPKQDTQMRIKIRTAQVQARYKQ